ncbi:MAG: hypothetical protein QXI39_01195 [Candidatus Bathyarchaeia archaeon]
MELRVKNVSVSGLEVSEGGLIYFSDSRKREKARKEIFPEEWLKRNLSLCRLIYLFRIMMEERISISYIEIPVLASLIQGLLSCSRKSAYDYAIAMAIISRMLR